MQFLSYSGSGDSILRVLDALPRAAPVLHLRLRPPPVQHDQRASIQRGRCALLCVGDCQPHSLQRHERSVSYIYVRQSFAVLKQWNILLYWYRSLLHVLILLKYVVKNSRVDRQIKKAIYQYMASIWYCNYCQECRIFVNYLYV